MNRKLVALALLAAIVSGCVSCGNAADEDPGTTEEYVLYRSKGQKFCHGRRLGI